MHGNNTMSKESFARSQAHPRKVELARILLGTEADKKQVALDSGFNEVIIQEMARDISKNVEGMESFAADLKNGVKAEEVTDAPETPETPETQVETEVEQSSETSNENQVPNESTDQIDPNATPENTVVDPTPETPVSNEGVEQSTPDTTTPESTTPQA